MMVPSGRLVTTGRDSVTRLCGIKLDINHHTTGIEDDAAFALVMDVAAGNDDLDDIALLLLVVPV
jgi:hypothetical protein